MTLRKSRDGWPLPAPTERIVRRVDYALVALDEVNLVCEGKETLIEGQAFAAHMTAQSEARDTFRVDVRNRRWCSGNCASTSPIAEVGETTITLKKVITDPNKPLDEEIIVQRETGRLLARWRTGGLTRMRDEQCARGPFTGFPERLF